MKTLCLVLLCATLVTGPLASNVATAGLAHAKPQRVKKARASTRLFLRNRTRVRNGTATFAERTAHHKAVTGLTVAAMVTGFVVTVAARAYGFHLDELQLAQPAWLAIPREGGAVLAIGAVLKFFQQASTPPQSAD